MKLNFKAFIFILALLGLFSPGVCASDEVERFNVAAKAFGDGFYDASLSLFSKFGRDFPESSLFEKSRLYIAKCRYYKQDYHQALEVLLDLEKLKTKDFIDEVYYLIGFIYFKGKDFDKAFDYVEKIINEYSNSKFKWQAHYLMADIYQEIDKTYKAKEIFNIIIDNTQNSELIDNSYSQLLKIHLQEKNYSQVISTCQDYIRRFSKGGLKEKVQFYLGESHYAQGDWNKALRSYQNALGTGQDSGITDLVYQGLGFTYLGKGQKNDAKINIDRIKDKQLRLFSQGVYYFKVKDYIQALETFNIFVRDYQQNPFLAQAYLNKADIFYEMGRLNDSIYVYQYILDNFKDSENVDTVNKAHYGLAWCHLKNGKFKKAIEEFESTLEYVDNPVVKSSSQIQIADAYQETGKYEEALDIYSRILKEQPNTVYADYIQFQIGMIFLKRKELEKSFLALNNLKNNFPSSRLIPQVQYYLAVGYFSQDNYVQAKNLLQNLIERFPQDDLIPKVHYLYGKCFFNEGDYRQALAIFKKIVGKYKGREIEELAYIDMGNAFLNLSLFDNAKKTWKDYLKRYPQSQNSGLVLLYLGGLYEKEKNYIEAEKYYKMVLTKHKKTLFAQEALLSLGHLYWNKGDLTKAQRYFEQLVKKDSPLAGKGKLYLAKVLKQQGKNQKALGLYNQLSDLESAISKLALADKAFLLKEMKNYQEAVTSFRKAIAAGVDAAEMRFSLGLCLEKIGQDDEAVEEFLKVIYTFSQQNKESLAGKSKNYEVKSYFRIARIYEKNGNIEAAKKTYKNIINLGVKEAKIATARLAELEGE